MTDHDLKFPDEATGRSLLGSALNAVVETETGPELACFTHDHCIGIIGEIYNGTKQVPGWHANLRLLHDQPLPDALVPYVVHPLTPTRQWA